MNLKRRIHAMTQQLAKILCLHSGFHAPDAFMWRLSDRAFDGQRLLVGVSQVGFRNEYMNTKMKMRIWAISIFVFTLFTFSSASSLSDPATDENVWNDLHNIADCAKVLPVAHYLYAFRCDGYSCYISPYILPREWVEVFSRFRQRLLIHITAFLPTVSSNFYRVNEDATTMTPNALELYIIRWARSPM